MAPDPGRLPLAQPTRGMASPPGAAPGQQAEGRLVDLVLGISAYFHDSAAALVADGELIAAAQEERFSRRRHDPGFPAQAAAYCLHQAGARLDDVGAVAYYEDAALKFRRVLATYLGVAPGAYASFRDTLPDWLAWKR